MRHGMPLSWMCWLWGRKSANGLGQTHEILLMSRGDRGRDFRRYCFTSNLGVPPSPSL
jgi:hypothetical protein